MLVVCYLRSPLTVAGANLRNENLLYSSLKDLTGKRGLKVVNLNIRSLLPKIAQVEAILEDESIDIVNLDESWLNLNISNNLLRIANYKLYRCDRAINKKGGGICIFVSNKLKVNAQTYESLNVSNKHIELFVLTIQQKCTKPV